MILALCSLLIAPIDKMRPLLVSAFYEGSQKDGSIIEENRTYLADFKSKRILRVSASFAIWSSDRQRVFLSDDDDHRGWSRIFNVDARWTVAARNPVGFTCVSWNLSKGIGVLVTDDELTVRSLSQGNARTIPTGKGKVGNPQVSADGKWIAFDKESARPWLSREVPDDDIWIVQTDGKGLRKLGKGGAPRWAPDGLSILSVESDPGALREINLRSRRWRTITRAFVPDDAAYSGDGKYVAVIGEEYRNGHMSRTLVVLDRNGHLVTALGKLPLPDTHQFDGCLSW